MTCTACHHPSGDHMSWGCLWCTCGSRSWVLDNHEGKP